MRARGVYRDGPAAAPRGRRSTAAWLGALILACGRPDDGQGSSFPADLGATDEAEPAAPAPDESSTGKDTDDAGASAPSGNGSTCPAPRPEAQPGVAPGWALDSTSGECCHYANRNAAPDTWLRFDSDIECRCSTESCPATIEEAEQRLCAVASPPANVQRFVGCGLVAVVDYSGYEWAFEQSGGAGAPAPRLVGAANHRGPSSFDAGATSAWKAGLNFATCDVGPAFECQLCGDDPATDFPPCE